MSRLFLCMSLHYLELETFRFSDIYVCFYACLYTRYLARDISILWYLRGEPKVVVGSTTRGTKSCGKFPGFAVRPWNLLRPTRSAKIWVTEIFAKHGRHAAFQVSGKCLHLLNFLNFIHWMKMILTLAAWGVSFFWFIHFNQKENINSKNMKS